MNKNYILIGAELTGHTVSIAADRNTFIWCRLTKTRKVKNVVTQETYIEPAHVDDLVFKKRKMENQNTLFEFYVLNGLSTTEAMALMAEHLQSKTGVTIND
ncbi:hypothetical protein VPH219E481_0076 [Vibrio phage 219E48-1]|nr:hypothetical protein PODOV021v1_p0063 [Vibrio phage 219E41.2]QZI91071.1 hypothetical protein PODOV032v1_p0066 [Vibrio phage 219E41.1]